MAPRLTQGGVLEFREGWRVNQCNLWRSSNPIDANVARNANLTISPWLVRTLHEAAQERSACEVGVMTGGFTSPAVDFSNRGSIIQRCTFCQDEVVPSLDHVFWSCSDGAKVVSILVLPRWARSVPRCSNSPGVNGPQGSPRTTTEVLAPVRTSKDMRFSATLCVRVAPSTSLEVLGSHWQVGYHASSGQWSFRKH